MSTTPQPPRPPVPPEAPRSSSHVVPIVLLILAIIVVVSAVAVWTGLRFLSRTVRVHVEDGAGGKKEVSIQTPVGSLDVAKDVNEARLGLPIYPGATQVKDNSVTLNMNFGSEGGFRLAVGKFETHDSFGKVKAFYQGRLGREVTKFTDKDSEGKTVFEIKRGDVEKIVALSSRDEGTRIELVHVVKGSGETN